MPPDQPTAQFMGHTGESAQGQPEDDVCLSAQEHEAVTEAEPTLTLPRSKRGIWLLVQVCIGLLAFGLLFTQVELDALVRSLARVQWAWVAVALAVPFAVHAVTWLQHAYLLSVLGRRQCGVWLFRVMLLSQGIGIVAPGKLGDFSVVWFFKKRGVPYSEGLAMAAYFKVIALFINGWIGLMGVALWLGNAWWLAGAAAGPAAVMVLWLAMRGRLPTGPLRRLLRGKHEASMAAFGRTWTRFMAVRPATVCIMLALIKTWVMALTPFILLCAYGHPISAAVVIMVEAVIRLVAMLPISPAGLGVRELSGAMLLAAWAGVPIEVAANVMLLTTAIQYTIAAGCYFTQLDLFADKGPSDEQ
jgi:uncharacterized membrane protein YbhN (UPF0104 family)